MTLKEETRKALLGSIEKWKNIAYHGGEELGSRNCPLCHLFLCDDCTTCPVALKTGRRFCDRTPYADWTNFISATRIANLPDACHDMAKEIALKEVKFLEDLLKEFDNA